jgi:hypothetical protein
MLKNEAAFHELKNEAAFHELKSRGAGDGTVVTARTEARR